MSLPAPEPIGLDRIEDAVADIAAGRPVLVVDDEDRENEGDLVFAAAHATPELVAFMVRHTSGVICVPMRGPDLDRLELPPMTLVNQDPKGTAYTVSVDAAEKVSTGISAADRCRTIRALADPDTGPHQLTRPGHVFPLRAAPGGVLRRPGHTEAAVDLARLAGLPEAGVICELVNEDGTMARLPDCRRFARTHGLRLVSIADLIAYRRRTEPGVERVVSTELPLAAGRFRAVGYRALADATEHLALVLGEVATGPADPGPLVRVHSECLTGDAFGSLRCDCGPQLDAALAQVAAVGRGVVLYLRGHEGRGIGLLGKLRAYQLQDTGLDTVEANLRLGLPVDARDFSTAAHILADLGVRRVRLLTNNPAKRLGLAQHGVAVTECLPLTVPANRENLRYLRTKRDRMGHLLPGLDPAVGLDGPDSEAYA